MTDTFSHRFNLGILFFSIAIAAVAILSGVMATQAMEDDGRINLVHHLGGDAVFCVGPHMAASDSYTDGGIRLLSSSGQQLFFVPAATIDAVPELPLVDTRLAQGWGSFGIVELWRLTNGNFSLVGQDEHNKPFIFEWTGCEQIGEGVDDGSTSDAKADEAPGCEGPQGGNGNDIYVPQATQEPGCEEPTYET